MELPRVFQIKSKQPVSNLLPISFTGHKQSSKAYDPSSYSLVVSLYWCVKSIEISMSIMSRRVVYHICPQIRMENTQMMMLRRFYLLWIWETWDIEPRVTVPSNFRENRGEQKATNYKKKNSRRQPSRHLHDSVEFWATTRVRVLGSSDYGVVNASIGSQKI